jgi:hypothetical protein
MNPLGIAPLSMRLASVAALAKADLGRAIVEPGELALERSRCDSVRFRVRESAELNLGTGSGLASNARRSQTGAAGVRICSRCRATQPERKRDGREDGEQ